MDIHHLNPTSPSYLLQLENYIPLVSHQSHDLLTIQIYEEMREIESEEEALLAEIEEFMGTDTDPWEAIRIQEILDPYETPASFYARTIHQGNIGVSLLDLSGYVEQKLSLDLPDSRIRLTI